MTQTDDPALPADPEAHNADTESPEAAPPADDGRDLIARPDKTYRLKHLVMAVLLIAGGAWFAYDGWVKWPRQNEEIARLTKEKVAAQEVRDDPKVQEISKKLSSISHHTDTDILIQKLLAFALPAFGLFWGGWTLRETCGHYHMTADTLHVPGHPPITAADVRLIDKRKWDKKGIAYLHYETGHPPAPGILKLDDFAYERTPTDQMLERIERNVQQTAPAAPSAG